ncbi:MAG: hypothetical protein V3V76_11035 [Candidatus Adiutricales bacterium]
MRSKLLASFLGFIVVLSLFALSPGKALPFLFTRLSQDDTSTWDSDG